MMENNDIVLYSEEYKVMSKEYKGKAKGWKDVRPGNILKFSFRVEDNSGGSQGRLYQSYIRVEVTDPEIMVTTSFYESLSQLNFRLSSFTLSKW